MADVTIDRLTLKLSGLSKADGQRLARRIAEGLVSASPPLEGMHSLDRLRIQVTAQTGRNIDLLAQQIVADVLRELERTL